jgi:hypothetical protein
MTDQNPGKFDTLMDWLVFASFAVLLITSVICMAGNKLRVEPPPPPRNEIAGGRIYPTSLYFISQIWASKFF